MRRDDSYNKVTRQKIKEAPRKGMLKQWLLALFLSLLLLAGGLNLFFYFPKMTGYSMLGTLEPAERLVVRKTQAVKRFSLVYFQLPNGETSIRRVIGLPGEKISYVNEQLYVDGQAVSERFLTEEKLEVHAQQELFTENFSVADLNADNSQLIPAESYLVLGDNRPYANDSRFYGFITHNQIKGLVSHKFWTLSKIES